MEHKVKDNGVLEGLKVNCGVIDFAGYTSDMPRHMFFINEGRLLHAELLPRVAVVKEVGIGRRIPISVSPYYDVSGGNGHRAHTHVLVNTTNGIVEIVASVTGHARDCKSELIAKNINHCSVERFVPGPWLTGVSFTKNTIAIFSNGVVNHFSFTGTAVFEERCVLYDSLNVETLNVLPSLSSDIVAVDTFEDSYYGGTYVEFRNLADTYILELERHGGCQKMKRCRLLKDSINDDFKKCYTLCFSENGTSAHVDIRHC